MTLYLRKYVANIIIVGLKSQMILGIKRRMNERI